MGATGVALTLCLYGVFLAACGYYGAWSRGMDPKAMHSLYMGGGGGGAMTLCGVLSSRSSTCAPQHCSCLRSHSSELCCRVCSCRQRARSSTPALVDCASTHAICNVADICKRRDQAAADLTVIPRAVTQTQDGGRDRCARRAAVGAAFLWSLHYAGVQGQHRSGMKASARCCGIADCAVAVPGPYA